MDRTSDELLTLREIARRAKIGPRRVRAAADSDAFPTFQIGGWRRAWWGDFLRWVETQRVRPAPDVRARVAEVPERDGGTP